MTEADVGERDETVRPSRAAQLLEEIVALVDAGELTATSAERGFLRGAAAAAERLPDPS